jgi:hypothetical protein
MGSTIIDIYLIMRLIMLAKIVHNRSHFLSYNWVKEARCRSEKWNEKQTCEKQRDG